MHWWTTSWLNPKENPFSFLSQQSTSSINQQMCRLTTSQLEMKGNPFSFFLLQQSTSNVNQLCQLTTSTQNNGESFLFPFPTINLFYPSTIVLIHNLSTWNKGDFFLLPLRTINQNKINQWLHWSTTLLFDLSAIHVNGFPLLSQQSTITMTIKWLLLIKCCCIVQHIFQPPHVNWYLLWGQKGKLNFSFNFCQCLHSLWYFFHRLQRYRKCKNLMFNSAYLIHQNPTKL